MPSAAKHVKLPFTVGLSARRGMFLGKLSSFFLLIAFVLVAQLAYSPVKAQAADTINFQSKIVDRTTGLNISDGSPACVVSGADTCDFRASIYTESSGGTLLWQEPHTDVELGDVAGIFNLELNSVCSSWDSPGGSCSGSGLDWGADSTVYIQIEIDTDGDGDFASGGPDTLETFARKLINSSAYAYYADSAGSIDGIDSSGLIQLQPGSAQSATGSDSLIWLNETGGSSPNLIELEVGGSDMFIVENDGDVAVIADLFVGGTSLVSPFSVDSDTNELRIGDGANDTNDPTLTFYASDGSESDSISVVDGGGFEFTNSILPSTDDTFDLGSNTNRWRDLYLGPSSLHIGNDGDEVVISYNTTSDQIEFSQPINPGQVSVTAATTSKAQLSLTSSVGVNPSAPGAGDLWYNGTNLYFYDGSSNIDLLTAGGGTTVNTAYIQHQETSGTDGGGVTGSSWNTADYDTEVSDPDSIVSVAGSGGEFTPTAGTYNIQASHQVFRTSESRLRLYNVTQASAVLYGQNALAEGSSGENDAFNATLEGTFTANGTDVYRIDVYTTVTRSGNGFGTALSLGVNEVYGTMKLDKITTSGGSDLFTDNGSLTYLTDDTDDFVIGGTTLASAFSIDVSSNITRIGDGANDANDPTLIFYASNASDSGSLQFTDNDSFFFSGGSVGIGVSNPGALLAIAASTTSSAQLNLASGVDPTTPNEGDIWYDGNQVKFYDGSDSVYLTNAEYANLQETQTSGTDGGGSSAATWNSRTINNEVIDSGGNVTVSSGQFTLTPGTYRIQVSAPAVGVSRHRLRLRNITDSTTDAVGASAYSGGVTAATPASLSTQITISASKTFEIQHYTESARAGNGLGEAAGDGETEVYTVVELWKIAE